MATSDNSFQASTNINPPANYRAGQWRTSVSTPKCGFCNKTVYSAEEITTAGQKFHKSCIKCNTCRRMLAVGNIAVREQKIYCQECYSRQWGPKLVGRGHATSYPSDSDSLQNSSDPNLEASEPNISNNDIQRQTSTGLSSGNASLDLNSQKSDWTTMSLPSTVKKQQTSAPSDRHVSTRSVNSGTFSRMSVSGNVCPRCSKAVYSAEEVKAIGKSFHKRCYTCANCKMTISGGNYSEHDGELYDNKCYHRLFGPTGLI